MPHKTCPHCGQPAVVSMPQCRRCGFVFPSAPPASFGVEARERPHERIPQASGSRSISTWLPLMLVCGALLGIVALARLRGVGQHALPTDGGHTGSALDFSPTDGAAPHGSSLFVESNSAQEMPQLTVRNGSGSGLTLTLRDRYGHVYRAICTQFGTADMQVPSGYYSVSIESDNPHIRPNWGDATFRKFKAYEADFVVGHRDERVHLGE